METRTVELPTPEGVICGKVAVPSGAIGLAQLVPTAEQLTDALVRRGTELVVLQDKTVSCGPRCGACCRHMVPLSPPEAFRLMDTLDALPTDARAAAKQRFDEIDARLEHEAIIDELLDPPPTDDPVLPIARRYFEMKMACPFLIDESCSIHARRPIGCRDFNVTSPAEWCARPYDHAIEKVEMPLPLSAALARLTAGLTGGRAQLIPLTLVPRWARANAELRMRTWPGLELFDRFLAELRAASAD